MNKKIIGILAFIIVAAGAWYGYDKWSEGQKQQKRRAVAEAKQNELDAMPTSSETSLSSMNLGAFAPKIEEPAAMPSDDPAAAISQDFETQRETMDPTGAPQLPPPPGIIPDTLVAPSQIAKNASVSAAIAANNIKDEEPAKVADILLGKKSMQYTAMYNQDPTLSKYDRDIAEANRLARIRTEENARKARLEAERQARLRREAEERARQELLKDPSRAIRNKIKIQGLVGQEVFINNKIYTVGSTILGAKIVYIGEDSVRFSYKGQTFTKKVDVK
ncbi:hypothetical protein Emin_0577 [Elusimicrobium minutum Pei191]|uniref:Uncharacterized protein n=1 Tax=Elusimicrobium minutum (strain Pei191) TaxID=445932 RepID=B2KC05_ELUMP|nr:hypothetical protein [Elusimicrobium minutum]ACC98132.1 hypothetical protein Emin_0577 [Elusimicrobium minutum Pei191]